MAKNLSDSIDEGLEKKKPGKNVSVVLDKILGGKKRNLTGLLTELGISESKEEMPIIEVKEDSPEEVVTPIKKKGKTSVANALAELDISNGVVIEEPEKEVDQLTEKVDQPTEKVEEEAKIEDSAPTPKELEISGFEKAEDSYKAEEEFKSDYLFDSDWIDEDDFKGKSLGSLDPITSERGEYVVHSLKTDLEHLLVKVLLRVTDSQGRLIDEGPLLDQIAEIDDRQYGIGIKSIDPNKIKVITGRDGVIWSASSDENTLDKRLVSEIDTESTNSYYKILVYNLLAMRVEKPQPQLYAAPRGAPGPPGPTGPAGGGGTALTVRELDGAPSGTDIETISFNSDFSSNVVIINGTEAIIGAPANAPTFHGTNLALSGATQYTGRLSQSNVNYEAGNPAGALVSYIQNDTTFTLTTQVDSNWGDKGIVKLYINGELSAAIDLGSNFVEGNRSTQQSMNDYDTNYVEGSTFVLTNGDCPFVGTYSGDGSLELTKVERYNNFDMWQSWRAVVNITSQLRQGYTSIYVTHVSIASQTDQSSNIFDKFYDNDAGANPSVTAPVITANTPVNKWLSGVKYYGSGSTFDSDLVVSDGFDNVYHSTNAPVTIYGWPGMSTTSILYTDSSVTGVSTPPDISETMTVTNFTFTQAANQFSDDAKLTARPRDPYGQYTTAQSTSGKWLVNSYGNPSDDLHEYFRDEDYRLTWNETSQDWDTPPASKTSNWDSTQSLLTYDSGNKHSQCWNSRLVYPDTNFSTGYMPTGNPNYSTFTGSSAPSFSSFSGNVAVFCRGFYDDNENHTNGRIYLTGITETQLEGGSIEVWIKVPTKTGWLDLSTNYNGGTFTGIDGDGCRINPNTYEGPEFEFSLGTFNTDANTKWGVIVLVIQNSTSPDITGSMYITNW